MDYDGICPNCHCPIGLNNNCYFCVGYLYFQRDQDHLASRLERLCEQRRFERELLEREDFSDVPEPQSEKLRRAEKLARKDERENNRERRIRRAFRRMAWEFRNNKLKKQRRKHESRR